MLVAALAGLALAVGGMCGVGPTSLSLLAVSAHEVPSPDDARGHVPVPAVAEVAQPAGRRVLRPGARRTAGRLARIVRGAAIAPRQRMAARRDPPPLRGPPPLVA